MDPRVTTPRAGLQRAHLLALTLFDAIAQDSTITARVRTLREQLTVVRTRVRDSSLTKAISLIDDKLVALAGGGGARGGGGAPGAAAAGFTLTSMRGELLTLMNLLEEADAEPTTAQETAVQKAQTDFAALVARWKSVRTTEMAVLNAQLRRVGEQAITAPPGQ